MKTRPMAPGDMFDRFTIMIRKAYKGIEGYENEIEQYMDLFKEEGLPAGLIWLLCQLQMLNTDIWNLESEVRKGKEGRLGHEEVGRRALEIRNINGIRIEIVNEINELFQDNRREVRKDHASE